MITTENNTTCNRLEKTMRSCYLSATIEVMEFRKIGNRYLLRISRGEEIIESITSFLKKQDIRAGSICGIGAVNRANLLYYSMEDKKYHGKEFEGEFEIVALNGNASILDKKHFPHIHIILANNNYNCFGGHLTSATVAVTCEVFIDPDKGEVVREFNEETKLNLWKLNT